MLEAIEGALKETDGARAHRDDEAWGLLTVDRLM